MVAPITYVDIYTALKEHNLSDATALSLLALLGEGLQTYGKTHPKPATVTPSTNAPPAAAKP
jgi:hypothetical protein